MAPVVVATGWARPLHVAMLVAATANCRPRDPSRLVAAEVGGVPVTVASIQAYFDANLLQEPAADAPIASDLERVKSRLLDDFIDEEIQLREAVRRGVVVTEQELSDYLGADAPVDTARRELAHRELMLQKLRESVVLAEVHVDEARVDAWLAAHAATEPPPVHGTLRTLRFASFPEAERVRREITSGKLSFLEAGVTYADGSGGGPREIDLTTLPPTLAEVVNRMRPGDVSPPVPFESSVLLFLLESIDDRGAAEARRRERVRSEIALEMSQAATERFLEQLRGKTPVVLHRDVLPFRYVPESAEAS